ncbi:MAG TPA: PadR family transcriptional regulator [Candidatus Cloacimonetes bacterium]|nr:PadR family transcriptional regulator [Candidatus Cloacimonadota bacterium]
MLEKVKEKLRKVLKEVSMNKSDLVVLGFLRRKSMYGYEIIQWLKTHHMDEWADVKMPSVYKAMQRLEKKEYISGEKVTEGNNPPRTVFSITEKGKEFLLEMLEYFMVKSENPHDFWIGICFLNQGFTKGKFLQILTDRKQKMKEHLKCHKQHFEQMKSTEKWKLMPFYIKTLMKMGTKMNAIEIESLDELKKEAENKENEIFFIKED